MKNKFAGKYYKFALYMVVVVLINLVGLNLLFRLDLTANKLYSLSKASKNAVASLKEPLTIKVFFSKNLPAPHNNTEKYLHDLLEEYEFHANKFLSYQFYDVSAKEGDLSEKAEGNRKIAQDYGVYPVNVQSREQDEVKLQRAYMGMVLIHGNVVEKIQAITSTDGLEYRITSAIQKMNNKISALLNLPEKIKVQLVQSSSLLQIANVVKLKGLAELEGAVKNVVSQLNSKAYDQLEFQFIDPTRNPELESQLEKFKRFSLEWPELKNPDGSVVATAGKGILALGMSYGKKSIEKQLLSKNIQLTNRGFEEQFEIADSKTIENFIEENIDNLIDINEDLGYLSSHGTESLSQNLPPQMQMMQQQVPALSNLNGLLSKSYTIKQIDLKEEEIPDSIDTLIIAGPKENFSDWQLFQIDQFLMQGKSLAIFLNSFNEIQQRRGQQMYNFNRPVYLPLNTGLDKLLNHYGLTVNKSYLLDENCYENPGSTNMESMMIYYAPKIGPESIDNSLPFLRNIKQLFMYKNSPLSVEEETIKKHDFQLHTLISSSPKAWEMKGQINLMPMFIRPPADDKEKKSYPLAYLLEGEFPSYFADKPVPEKPKKEEKKDAEKQADEGENKDQAKAEEPKEEKKEVKKSQLKQQKEVIRKGKPGKIFLVGSSEILKNNIIDQDGLGSNAIFMVNTIDYLNNREDIAVMRAKNQRFNPIKEVQPFVKRFIKILNIGGLPAIIIILGIFIWIRRQARKKTIQAMFSK